MVLTTLFPVPKETQVTQLQRGGRGWFLNWHLVPVFLAVPVVFPAEGVFA